MLQHDTTPAEVHRDRLEAFQRSLLAEGLPLAWIVDVGVAHPAFSAVQSLFMAKRLDIGLRFEPNAPLTADDWLQWGGRGTPPATRAEGALQLMRQP